MGILKIKDVKDFITDSIIITESHNKGSKQLYSGFAFKVPCELLDKKIIMIHTEKSNIEIIVE